MVPGRTTYFEVRVDGRQVAATPGYEQLADDSVLRTTAEVQTTSGLVELVAASPEEPIERSVDAVRGGLLAALPLLVVGAGGLTWVLAGRALRPVESHPGRGRVDQRHDARPPGARTRLGRRGGPAGRDDERDARPARGRVRPPAAVRRRRLPRARAAPWPPSAPSSRSPSAPPRPRSGRRWRTGCSPRRPGSRRSSPTCCCSPPSTRGPRCPTPSRSTSPTRPAKRPAPRT